MPRVRIKICGVGDVAAGQAAVLAGADAIGLVFYPDSPRAVSCQRAREIARGLPPLVSRVALFLDADRAEVARVVEQVRPDLLQFHGRESAAFCDSFDRPYIKSVPMGEQAIDIDAWAREYDSAQALLLDAHRAGQAGGRGRTFDWQSATAAVAKPLILAGGLDADNVGEAIRLCSPYAVDVSSAVESAPGRKDAARLNTFVRAVQQAG